MANYDFHQLSPHDLEILARDLLQAEWGITLESFKTGRDGGGRRERVTTPGAPSAEKLTGSDSASKPAGRFVRTLLDRGAGAEDDRAIFLGGARAVHITHKPIYRALGTRRQGEQRVALRTWRGCARC